MRSSYTQNKYDEVLASIVSAYNPLNPVELGILDGFSTKALAVAQSKCAGRPLDILHAYDLFEDYPHKHANEADVREALKDVPNLQIFKQDAYTVHNNYPDNYIGLLHVDISNTGDTVKFIMENWDRKMQRGGIILFEGGTEERDQVEWMVKYNKPPMKAEIETNKIIEAKYIYATYLPFPGLTMIYKKRD